MTKEKKIDFPGYNLFQPLSFINSTIAVSSNIAYLAGGKKIFFSPPIVGGKWVMLLMAKKKEVHTFTLVMVTDCLFIISKTS